MRNISVSAEVFAAIWAQRKHGEASEDAILGRILLGLEGFAFEPEPVAEEERGSGEMRIEQYDIRLPPGFRIFRTYKGKFYAATVEKGRWLLQNDGRSYESLHSLSRAVVRRGENAWKYWNYSDEKGRISSISRLRRRDLVRKKGGIEGSARSASGLNLPFSEPVSP
jgi:hypothetical protein